jgi:uncharacterized protein YggU (UPF0235/DUF167 family)
LAVRLTPRSSRAEISGIDRLANDRTVLKVRVRALPQNNEANEALLRLIAKALHIQLASVRLESGATSRVKTLVLTGDAEALQTELTRLTNHPSRSHKGRT